MLLIICLLWLVACARWRRMRLYVVQSQDESLGRIDLASGEVDGHVLDLGFGCNDIIRVGERLYVTNSGLNTVQEIDAASAQTLRELPTTGGVNPYSLVALNPDTLAVSCWVSNNVLLLRLSDGAVVGDIPVGIGPEGMLVVGEKLFVCLTRFLEPNVFGPGAVMIYDRTSLELLDSLQVGVNPQTLAMDGEGRLHVVCTNAYGGAGGSIHVFDAVTLAPDTVLPTGGSPAAVSFGGGYAFVAAGGWATQGEVYRYRLADLALLNDATHPLATGLGATDVEARADGSFFVSCYSASQVEHRAADGTLLATYPLSPGPGQMVLIPGPNGVEPPQGMLPADARIAEAYPNPFNGEIRLVLSGVRRSLSYIRIYNILGREVAAIGVPAGVGAVSWNPALKSGITVPSGTYWAVWEGSGGEMAVKLLYLK